MPNWLHARLACPLLASNSLLSQLDQRKPAKGPRIIRTNKNIEMKRVLYLFTPGAQQRSLKDLLTFSVPWLYNKSE